jgi:hypothetical protein
VRCLLLCLFVCGLSEGCSTPDCVQQPFVFNMARSVVSATCFTQHYGHLQGGLYFNTKTNTLPPGLSVRGLGFDPTPVQLRFVVDKDHWYRFLSEHFCFHQCCILIQSHSNDAVETVCPSVPHLNSDVTAPSARRLCAAACVTELGIKAAGNFLCVCVCVCIRTPSVSTGHSCVHTAISRLLLTAYI